jgi:hypothetical protein
LSVYPFQLNYVQDLLPSLICESCKSKIILSFQFKKLCIKNENFLQQTHPELYENPDEKVAVEVNLECLIVQKVSDAADEMVELLEIDESCPESPPETVNRQKIIKTFDIAPDIYDVPDQDVAAEDDEMLLPTVYPIRSDRGSDTSNRVKVVSNEKSRAKYYSKCDICLQYFQNLKQHSLTHTRYLLGMFWNEIREKFNSGYLLHFF